MISGKKFIASLTVIAAVPFYICAQNSHNLAKDFQNGKLVVVHRTAATSPEQHGAIFLDERKGEGTAWLTGKEFSGGTIEIDLKGKDEFQKSFLGIAFHGVNDSTYDAIYFRPFNFKTKDSVRAIHAVQYISHPKFTWKKLREEKNAQFEKSIVPAPDPNDWFHAKIEVKEDVVLVFVNRATEPSLKIKKLNSRKSGKIGLWVGDGSGGAFANLSIHEQR